MQCSKLTLFLVLFIIKIWSQKVVNRSRGIFAIGQAVEDYFYQPSFCSYYNSGVYINAQG